jgi:hypothetical protein
MLLPLMHDKIHELAKGGIAPLNGHQLFAFTQCPDRVTDLLLQALIDTFNDSVAVIKLITLTQQLHLQGALRGQIIEQKDFSHQPALL